MSNAELIRQALAAASASTTDRRFARTASAPHNILRHRLRHGSPDWDPLTRLHRKPRICEAARSHCGPDPHNVFDGWRPRADAVLDKQIPVRRKSDNWQAPPRALLYTNSD